MNETAPSPRPRGLTIAHTASLVDEDLPAFRHAVAIAQRSQSRLVSVHAGESAGARGRIPRAADVLSRWGLVPDGAGDADVANAGVRHERVVEPPGVEPVAALVAYLRRLSPDLLVATTEARKGIARLFAGSVAEALARGVGTPALIFPAGCRGFVDVDSGKVSMGRVVVPVGDAESAVAATTCLSWFVDTVGAGMLDVELVHAGEVKELEGLRLVQREGIRFHEQAPTGSIEDAILAAAESTSADLIVMATRGHDSLGDTITGSHTERVLRLSPCPLLSVPIG
jgi:nucleotide-binding universal stress UspA family protein